MDLDKVSPELMRRARDCETADELFALAETEGIDLDDEQLEGVTGGWDSCDTNQGFGT